MDTCRINCEVEVIALPNYELQEDQFKEQVVELRNKFSNSISPRGLAGDRRDVVPASAFSLTLQNIWQTIKQNKDIHLPALEVMVASVRCEEIAKEKLSLFASFETTSLALTLATKFLSDHPLVFNQLTEEHDAIIRKRETADSGLTWSEYKSMKFTFQVINETVRLANIVPGIFRKAMRETEFKGYTIPAGWAVMVCPPAVHLNPSKYKDPLEFNPWRWECIDTNGASKNFMAFGGGMRFCVGTDFTKSMQEVVSGGRRCASSLQFKI